MQIIQALLFIFIVNSPNSNSNEISLRNALINNWRVVEISKKTGKKLSYEHPQICYKFEKNGNGKAYYKKKTTNFKWSISGSNLILSIKNKEKTNIKVYFVNSTSAALKKASHQSANIGYSFLLIKAMPSKK